MKAAILLLFCIFILNAFKNVYKFLGSNEKVAKQIENKLGENDINSKLATPFKGIHLTNKKLNAANEDKTLDEQIIKPDVEVKKVVKISKSKEIKKKMKVFISHDDNWSNKDDKAFHHNGENLEKFSNDSL